MAAISGKAARIKHTAATATSSTNNAATLSTDGVTLQIDSTALRHWDKYNSTALRVFDTSTEISSSDFDVNWVQGKVTFDSARSTGNSYTIDCETFTSSFLVGGRSWTVDASVNDLETTTFSTDATDAKWRSFIGGLSDATVSVSQLYPSGDTGPLWFDRINADQRVLVQLWTDHGASNRYEGWGVITRDGISNDLDGLVEQSVDVRLDGQLYFTTG